MTGLEMTLTIISASWTALLAAVVLFLWWGVRRTDPGRVVMPPPAVAADHDWERCGDEYLHHDACWCGWRRASADLVRS